MEQIEQLREMRDAALVRLENNPDYKLAKSLSTLIGELQDVIAEEIDAATSTVSTTSFGTFGAAKETASSKEPVRNHPETTSSAAGKATTDKGNGQWKSADSRN